MREMLLKHLKLFVGIVQLIAACSSLSMSEFYPYGVGNGDTELPANDDGSSGEIPISILFPYFDRNHDSLFVNTNGVVSFLVAVSQYTPAPFPLGDQRRLISPFWGDVDTRNGGTVFYRESTDTLLLQRATADIRRAFVIHQKFTATWIFIATWDRVAFYGASGGMQSKAGFNAGDGIRFFQINGSRTNDILNLPSTSNVALPGQWIFRTDEASVEAGGCNTKGSLTISPRSGIMLGGTNLKMSGPCFKQNDNIVVQFDGNVNINATFGTEIQSSVTVPVLNKTGRVPIKLSVDGGNSFDYNGVYTSVPINRNIPDVQREDGNLWQEDSSVDISWDSGSIGGNDDQVSIDLARYKMGEDSVPELDSFHTVVDSQLNTGHSQFVVTQGEGDGNIEDRYVNLVRISRKDGTNNVSRAQWVWSELFAWRNAPWADERCKIWHQKEPNPNEFKATGFGDPHMVTLDGTPFTFNGYGEYFILKVRGINFTLQGRMEPLIGDDGTKTDATVYTAFAGKESGSDTVQIHLNGRGLVDVLVNGEMVDFDELSFLEFNGVSVLKYVNTSKYSAIFHSGISVTVEGQTELLGLVTLVPTMFKGNTSGLLGYWDDSQESEYLRPDGTFLETNSSLEEIHRNFGQLWVTTENESLFTYQQGKNHGSYFHPDYTPIFPDSQELVFEDKSLEEEAKGVCGDSAQCMFDIYTTKKVTIGKASKETVEQFVAVINDTVKPACVPLDSELTNGIVLRNDTENGIDYKFTCNRGFVINGSNHVTCKDGVYNGTTPNCLPKECSPFEYGNPTNGRVEGNGRVYRSTYRFICNHGYVLFGHDTITCIENGTWNGTSPRCLKECPVLPSSLSNGIVYGSGNVEGVVYRFSCHDGYALVGSEIVYCRENGHWNASVPSCLRECPALPLSLSNGFVSGRGTVEGSHHHFSCKTGYSLVGAGTLYCSDQGIWNGSFPTCFIECPELPSFIPNGQVYGSGSIQGSLFRFSCLAGYSLIGQSNTLLCNADGKWNASVPRCLKDCPLLPSSIPNGVSNGTGSVEGSHHYFTCDEGFSLVGRNTLFCNDEGKWNGSVPTCVIECPKLPSAIEHGIVKGSGYIHGSLYKFSCLSGYSIVGEDILYCTEKGMWNGSVPKCLKECPSLPSSIAHGFVNGSGYLEGSQHHFTCGRGYSLIGVDTLVCSDTGAWSSPLPKCLIECPSLPPSIRHGFVNGTGSVEGSLYTFSCKYGYSLVGKRNLYCNAEGRWNASIPICLKECPELPSLIANGFLNGSGALHGSLYTFKCQDGYSLVGHELLYCTEEGKWNASVPVCLKECPSLPSSISQGFINGSGSVEGSLYSFSCEYGYSLIGEKNLYCTAEGRWNASIPICLKDCPTLPLSLPNGMVSGTGSVEGSYYYFSCQKHYSLLGANTLFCNKKGTWNGSVPACFKDCPEINQSLEHGHMNGSGSTFGTTYSFYCDEGYKIDGQSTVFCDEQGQWNATIPVCSRVHVGKIAKKTAWYVVPFSATSGLVFIIIATGVVILLLRRWRSTRKSEEPMDGEEMEMNEQAITPRKTKVRWECLPILKTPKETPAVV